MGRLHHRSLFVCVLYLLVVSCNTSVQQKSSTPILEPSPYKAFPYYSNSFHPDNPPSMDALLARTPTSPTTSSTAAALSGTQTSQMSSESRREQAVASANPTVDPLNPPFDSPYINPPFPDDSPAQLAPARWLHSAVFINGTVYIYGGISLTTIIELVDSSRLQQSVHMPVKGATRAGVVGASRVQADGVVSRAPLVGVTSPATRYLRGILCFALILPVVLVFFSHAVCRISLHGVLVIADRVVFGSMCCCCVCLMWYSLVQTCWRDPLSWTCLLMCGTTS